MTRHTATHSSEVLTKTSRTASTERSGKKAQANLDLAKHVEQLLAEE